jgi:nitroreductase
VAILLTDDALDTVFRKARTHSYWKPDAVPDNLLRQIYDLAKLGPTSANTMPVRAVFVKSPGQGGIHIHACVPQRHARRGVPHRRGARTGFGLRTHVRVRQCQG